MIEPGLDAEALEQVDHVFRGDVPVAPLAHGQPPNPATKLWTMPMPLSQRRVNQGPQKSSERRKARGLKLNMPEAVALLDRLASLGYVVEQFNNRSSAMATINFSVPEDVKQAFNAAFQGQNKSAVLTQLLREAIARVEEQRRRESAASRILARRRTAPVRSAKALATARQSGRP